MLDSKRSWRPRAAWLQAAGLTAALTTASAVQPALAGEPVASWGTALMVPNAQTALTADALRDATLRQAMRLTLGGERLRVRVSNRFGDGPLVVQGASVGHAARPGDAALAGKAVLLRFGGQAGITLAAGAEAWSDPADLATRAGDLVAVSLHLQGPPPRQSAHIAAHATQFRAPGDQTMRPTLEAAQPLTSWFQVDAIDVIDGSDARTPAAPRVLVAIGDSITDGTGAGLDRDERWPDWLARRVHADEGERDGEGRRVPLAVINAGIGGNRMLADDNGPNLLSRFAHDALDRDGVTHVLALIGVNDLGRLHRDGLDTPSGRANLLAGLEQGWRQLAQQAHARGVCLIAGTLTPYGATPIYAPTPDNEADRESLNDWLRAHAQGDDALFDGLADFDAAVRDRESPTQLRPGYDNGDHLHLSPAGYRAMADAVPLDRLAGCRWRREKPG